MEKFLRVLATTVLVLLAAVVMAVILALVVQWAVVTDNIVPFSILFVFGVTFYMLWSTD